MDADVLACCKIPRVRVSLIGQDREWYSCTQENKIPRPPASTGTSPIGISVHAELYHTLSHRFYATVGLYSPFAATQWRNVSLGKAIIYGPRWRLVGWGKARWTGKMQDIGRDKDQMSSREYRHTTRGGYQEVSRYRYCLPLSLPLPLTLRPHVLLTYR